MPEPPPKSADAIFAGALSRPAAGREAFVAAACGDNGELLAEVGALLAAHAEAPSGFLSEPAGGGIPDDACDSAPTIQTGDPALAERVHALLHAREDNAPSPAAPGEKPGERIGPYKLLQELCEGGFGTVWMAEQKEPISRMVALKEIKRGVDTREVIARFEAERQALAMMDHPHIAKVLDAGATDPLTMPRKTGRLGLRIFNSSRKQGDAGDDLRQRTWHAGRPMKTARSFGNGGKLSPRNRGRPRSTR